MNSDFSFFLPSCKYEGDQSGPVLCRQTFKVSNSCCDFETWVKVRSDAFIGFSICDFLFIPNTSTLPILPREASTGYFKGPLAAVTFKLGTGQI